jgi:hypothetical protein
LYDYCIVSHKNRLLLHAYIKTQKVLVHHLI